MKRKNTAAIALSAAAAVGAAGSILPIFVRPPKMKIESAHGREWMSVIDDNVLLSELAIPGTHDSGAEKIPFAFFSKCQNLPILSQLEAGCRFLDIRLRLKKGVLTLVHGQTPCLNAAARLQNYTLDQFLTQLYTFLKENPTETVLVSVKRDSGEKDGFVEAFYEKYLCAAPRYWYLENRVPTLGETRGRAVLLRRFSAGDYPLTDQNGGLNMNPQLWWDMSGKKIRGYKKFPMESLNGGNGAGVVCLQDCFSLAPQAKWHGAFQPLLDRGRYEGETMLNFLSCTGFLSPAAAAVGLNRRFLGSNGSMMKNGGIYIFDFIDAEVAEKVYEANAPHRVPEKRYPVNNRAYAPQPETVLSRWLGGYTHLVYHAASRI